MIARPYNTDLLDRATSEALHSLDPAANVDRHLVGMTQAQATLARILTTEPADLSMSPPVRTRLACNHPRRWVLAGAAVVGAGALVVAPGMVGGEAAFASWSATPRAVPPAEATVAGEDCRTRYMDDPSGVADRKVVDNAAIVLVERRGDWTYVVLGGAGGFEATCLLRDNGPGMEVTGGGYVGTLEAATLAPNTVVTHGSNALSGDDSSYREITGRVGSDVASVVLNTRQQGPVTATVHGGYFAAWWPGPPIVGMQGPGTEPTITLILKDGTSRADIPMAQLEPARP
jgi:hypothetical protein